MWIRWIWIRNTANFHSDSDPIPIFP
jgi:hypothetical protein